MILIFIPNGIGDVIMAFPVLRRLVNTYGDGGVVVVVAGQVQQSLIASTFGRGLTCWCRLDGKPLSQLRLLMRIVWRRFDICFAPLISNKLINKLFFLMTFTKVIFPSSSINQSIFGVRKGKLCLNDYAGHQVNYLISFVGSHGANIDVSTASSNELIVSSPVVSKWSLSDEIVLAVGLSCGQAERHKIPKPRFFSQLVNALAQETTVRVFVFGTQADMPLISDFESRIRGDIEVMKAIDEPVADVISMLSRCDVGVVGTTGQGHMMAAAGLPLLITAGVTEPYESGPYVSRAHVLKHGFPCAPCYQEAYRFGCGRIECMETLSPEKGAFEVIQLARGNSYGLSWLDGVIKTHPLPKIKINNIVSQLLDQRDC